MVDQSVNLAALKLKDPYVVNILDNAAHVALYGFAADSEEWEKLNIEGSLFLYTRSTEPKHKICILNRLNTSNMTEAVTEALEIHMKPPFLLYRNGERLIRGIWFYNDDECAKIANSVRTVLANNKSNGEISSKRVLDFISKVSSNKSSQNVQPMKSNLKDDSIDTNPILQHLMKSQPQPLQTVEQIEKQQRNIVNKSLPQPQFSVKISPPLLNGFRYSPPQFPLEVSELERSVVKSSTPIKLKPDSPLPQLLRPNDFVINNGTTVNGTIILNKRELADALINLLQNDDQFITRIHESYMQSILNRNKK